uniref:RRM domain-containing protein n=1 Tax=Macrostomum lignano TaxID=282301 RepID=A0A1I8JQ51_9PLAT
HGRHQRHNSHHGDTTEDDFEQVVGGGGGDEGVRLVKESAKSRKGRASNPSRIATIRWNLTLSALTTETLPDDLMDKFNEYGEVKSLHLNLNRRTGYIKGYALVEFEHYKEASTAQNKLNGADLNGQRMQVDWAFTRGPSGGGGGGASRDASGTPSRSSVASVAGVDKLSCLPSRVLVEPVAVALTPPDADGGPGRQLGLAGTGRRWHPFLVRHWQRAAPKEEAAAQQQQVLVLRSMCGASLDLTWLLGAALASPALVGVDLGGESVFRRLHLQPPPGRTDCARACTGSGLALSGCTAGSVPSGSEDGWKAGQSDLVWDRGSLVVINSADRRAYVALLHSLCRPSHRILLETTVFPQGAASRPRRSASMMIRRCISDLYDIQLLEAFRDEERLGCWLLGSNQCLHV